MPFEDARVPEDLEVLRRSKYLNLKRLAGAPLTNTKHTVVREICPINDRIVDSSLVPLSLHVIIHHGDGI